MCTPRSCSALAVLASMLAYINISPGHWITCAYRYIYIYSLLMFACVAVCAYNKHHKPQRRQSHRIAFSWGFPSVWCGVFLFVGCLRVYVDHIRLPQQWWSISIYSGQTQKVVFILHAWCCTWCSHCPCAHVQLQSLKLIFTRATVEKRNDNHVLYLKNVANRTLMFAISIMIFRVENYKYNHIFCKNVLISSFTVMTASLFRRSFVF